MDVGSGQETGKVLINGGLSYIVTLELSMFGSRYNTYKILNCKVSVWLNFSREKSVLKQ